MRNKGCLIGGGILGAIALVVIIGIFWFMGKYNSMVPMEEGVKSQWGNVENTYQKRADMVDQLVGTVTPLGGLLMIIGWGILVFYFAKTKFI